MGGGGVRSKAHGDEQGHRDLLSMHSDGGQAELCTSAMIMFLAISLKLFCPVPYLTWLKGIVGPLDQMLAQHLTTLATF